jgi:hypothetical protein
VAPSEEEGAADPVATLTEEVQALRREVARLTQHVTGASATGPDDTARADAVVDTDPEAE